MFKQIDLSPTTIQPTFIRSSIVANPRRSQEKIIKIDFSGRITGDVIAHWAKEDAPRVVGQVAGSVFYVIADLRGASVLSEKDSDVLKATDVMAEGQKQFLKAGMVKSYIIASSSTVLTQFRRISDKSGIRKIESGIYILPANQKALGGKLSDTIIHHMMRWYYDGIEIPVPHEVK